VLIACGCWGGMWVRLREERPTESAITPGLTRPSPVLLSAAVDAQVMYAAPSHLVCTSSGDRLYQCPVLVHCTRPSTPPPYGHKTRS
jgi:hypothetical protein